MIRSRAAKKHGMSAISLGGGGNGAAVVGDRRVIGAGPVVEVNVSTAGVATTRGRRIVREIRCARFRGVEEPRHSAVVGRGSVRSALDEGGAASARCVIEIGFAAAGAAGAAAIIINECGSGAGGVVKFGETTDAELLSLDSDRGGARVGRVEKPREGGGPLAAARGGRKRDA